MGSREDLAVLRTLIRSEPEIDEGLAQYCVLVAEGDSFDTWVDAPPRRGEPFAHDGSEHEFCLLDNGVVMLYTPLSDTPYHVVGADLREFLGLLLHGNGAQLGALAYAWDESVSELAGEPDSDGELSDPERHALARLTEVFGLVRWPDPRARLTELEVLLPAT